MGMPPPPTSQKWKKNTKPLIPVHTVKMFVSNYSNYGVPYLFYLFMHAFIPQDWVTGSTNITHIVHARAATN